MGVLTVFTINDVPQLFLHGWFHFKVLARFRKDEIFTMEYIHLLVPRYCVLGIFLPRQWTELFSPYYLCQQSHNEVLITE